MRKRSPVVLIIFAASSVVATAQEPEKRPNDAPSAAPTPTPAPRTARGGNSRRPADAPPKAPPVGRPRENHTQVQVSSVDVVAGTMTFTDVEGETNTWRFEPAAIARDQLLEPGARVTIVWRSDPTGQPIPTILGVMAFTPRAPATASPTRRRPADARQDPPKGPDSPAPSPTPPPR